MKLEIRKKNINSLETMHLNIFTIEHYQSYTDDDDIFTKKFIENIHNFPNLKNFYVFINGTNTYHADFSKFEQLFFLFDNDFIENIRITNGYYEIYKKNGKICARIPYLSKINLHPCINKIYFILNGTRSGYVNFRTIYNNFSTSLKKITFVVTLASIQSTVITLLDNSQKLPFGTELFLQIRYLVDEYNKNEVKKA